MEFLILGPLEVRDGDRLLPVGGGKQRALLAILLSRANEVVSKGRLIDELWQSEPPETAVNGLQVNVSQLRKALPPGVLVTRSPGYSLRVELGELDLHRFEQLVEEALAEDDSATAAATLREALALWRGPALADFVDEPFAQPEIARLEELRLTALERRIEADLALGRHAELVGELEGLSARHPLRERPRGQLMLALYRSGRQAEALGVYQRARQALSEQLGIEPSEALRELERGILRHDPALDIEPATRAAEPVRDVPATERSILIVPRSEKGLDALLAIAEPLARSAPPRELILARLVAPPELGHASAVVGELRADLIARGVAARAAVFTSKAPSEDIVLLASEQEADLLLVDSPLAAFEEGIGAGDVGAVLAEAPCDVAVFVERDSDPPVLAPTRPVLVPFGGAEHDWAALELGVWIAGAHRVPLKLAGVAADLAGGGRDASRLLARASLIVQKVAGIAPEPFLVEPGEEGLIRAAEDAGLLVVGLPPEWRQEGLGRVRLAVARRARPPTLLVRRGLRPGGIAPREKITRFTWTLAAPGS